MKAWALYLSLAACSQETALLPLQQPIVIPASTVESWMLSVAPEAPAFDRWRVSETVVALSGDSTTAVLGINVEAASHQPRFAVVAALDSQWRLVKARAFSIDTVIRSVTRNDTGVTVEAQIGNAYKVAHGAPFPTRITRLDLELNENWSFQYHPDDSADVLSTASASDAVYVLRRGWGSYSVERIDAKGLKWLADIKVFSGWEGAVCLRGSGFLVAAEIDTGTVGLIDFGQNGALLTRTDATTKCRPRSCLCMNDTCIFLGYGESLETWRLCSLSTDGQTIWYQSEIIPNSADGFGGAVLVGESTSGDFPLSTVLASIDVAGNLRWSKTFLQPLFSRNVGLVGGRVVVPSDAIFVLDGFGNPGPSRCGRFGSCVDDRPETLDDCEPTTGHCVHTVVK